MRALSSESTALRQQKINELASLKETLRDSLNKISRLGLGAPVGASHANFLMIPVLSRETRQPDSSRAQIIYKALAEDMGVVVRYRGSEVNCRGCLRITIGNKEENETILQKIQEALLKY